MSIRLHGYFLLIGMVVVMIVSGCGGSSRDQQTRSTWERTTIEQLDREMGARFERAERAREKLGKTLFGRLTEVMSTKGPAEAVDVCNVEARGMTKSIGKEFNVNIGRTSYRLRNPNNKPPEWAQQFDLVEKRVEKQVILKNGTRKVAVFTPIYQAGKCMSCHGPKDQISSGVKNVLDERYPRDEATGFTVGDLRGWFWVEVPATKS